MLNMGFPHKWRESSVCPIAKVICLENVTNLRPISLIRCISKILEKTPSQRFSISLMKSFCLEINNSLCTGWAWIFYLWEKKILNRSFTSHFSGRSQRVKFDSKTICSGCPQSSNLRPLLFMILHKLSNFLRICLTQTILNYWITLVHIKQV